MRQKSEVFSILLSFHSYVATQHRLPILAFHNDNGKEFDNFTMHSFFTDQWILRMLNDSVCTMLIQSRAPSAF
jgi:hypothetical protein